MERRWRFIAVLSGFLKTAAGQDSVALLQHSLSANEAEASLASTGATLDRLLADQSIREITKQGPRYLDVMMDGAAGESVADAVSAGKEYTPEFHSAVSRAWKSFHRRSKANHNPTPQTLLENGKMALLETGAFQEMRKLARATSNRSRTMTQGAVPLDSMIIGFRSSVAPWNNILKMFSIPLIKADFNIFSNFFGPDGNAARLCVSAAVTADSTYGQHTHSEFSGINIFIGPAKWDNIPGWSFGTSGGVDDVRILDVADFGWAWTLSREPETVCFLWDICVINDEDLHSNLLQTDSQAEQESSKVATVPRHGSTWVEHTWCSPDWENTPLVLPDDTSGSTMQEETEKDGSGKPYFKAEEEWDPESEAV